MKGKLIYFFFALAWTGICLLNLRWVTLEYNFDLAKASSIWLPLTISSVAVGLLCREWMAGADDKDAARIGFSIFGLNCAILVALRMMWPTHDAFDLTPGLTMLAFGVVAAIPSFQVMRVADRLSRRTAHA